MSDRCWVIKSWNGLYSDGKRWTTRRLAYRYATRDLAITALETDDLRGRPIALVRKAESRAHLNAVAIALGDALSQCAWPSPAMQEYAARAYRAAMAFLAAEHKRANGAQT